MASNIREVKIFHQFVCLCTRCHLIFLQLQVHCSLTVSFTKQNQQYQQLQYQNINPRHGNVKTEECGHSVHSGGEQSPGQKNIYHWQFIHRWKRLYHRFQKQLTKKYGTGVFLRKVQNCVLMIFHIVMVPRIRVFLPSKMAKSV